MLRLSMGPTEEALQWAEELVEANKEAVKIIEAFHRAVEDVQWAAEILESTQDAVKLLEDVQGLYRLFFLQMICLYPSKFYFNV